jgi:serine/threonine-protein kinase
MGTVYRARDNRLRRDVALKVLPEELRLSPARLARFEQEARLVAALNHPNIAAIYGIEDGAAGVQALVLELVEGKTLASRIAEGRLSVSEALNLARQIAQALDAAHEKGIVHRDLKPANVVITPTGLVKVLDFGVATMAEPAETVSEETVTAGFTREGVIVGTPAYMSPEQSRGQAVDTRADIWAFGCVLYEMLTGQRAFAGETSSQALAAVQTTDPDWSRLPRVPAVVGVLLKRCLERERAKRLGNVAAIRFALEDVPAAVERASTWKRGAALTAATVVLMVAAAAGFIAWNSRPVPAASVAASASIATFPIDLPEGLHLAALTRPAIALSPDGKLLAFVATREGEDARQIYVHSIENEDTWPVAGTERASNPFFSPDSSWLGFYANDLVLTRIPVKGGVAEGLTRVTIPSGASWSDHTIAYPPYLSVIQGVSDKGSAPQPLTRFENGETQHMWPDFLPDGKGLLFAAVSAGPAPQIAVQPIGAGTRRNLQGLLGTTPHYLTSGHVVYAHDGNVMAVPFDLDRLDVKGSAAPIPAVKGVSQREGTTQYSVSATGSLAYVPGKVESTEYRLVVVNRRDKTERQLNVPPGRYNQPRFSPDDRYVAIDAIGGPGRIQVWLYDLMRDQFTQFTYSENGVNRHAIWQGPKRIIYMSSRNGPSTQIFSESIDHSGLEQLTHFPPTPGVDILPIPYSICGNDLTVVRFGPTVEAGTVQMGNSPAVGTEAMKRLNLQLAAEGAPQLSPDCRWVAYASDESGRREIFVSSFPNLENKKQISANGGNEPLWNPNPRKRELFYRLGDKMIAVDLNDDGSPRGKPQEVFTRPYGTSMNFSVRPNYDVSHDGERLLVLNPATADTPLKRIKVVLNWHEELKRLVPAD